MAVSGWLVWKIDGFGIPLEVYFISLVFNAAWSAFFFGLHRPDLAFLDVMLLWISIAATIAVFYPVDRFAAYLLLPYLGWVSFASALNFTIWRMNRGHMPI
jgi:tryptophan-rich sensory protein